MFQKFLFEFTVIVFSFLHVTCGLCVSSIIGGSKIAP
uniref:Uncharacterized protein n=1 Tax=Anguilla anguilla TaxID=7936 RepID=A0A0E9P8F0_ANGAN